MRILSTFLLFVAAGLLAGAGVSRGSAELRQTTLAWANGPVLAFAQDGPYIAWATSHDCLAVIRIRSLAERRQRIVGTGDPQGHCDYLARTQLVLGGQRAVWTHVETGNEFYTYADSATLDGTRARSVTAASWDMSGYGIGDHVGGLAAHDSTIVFSTIRVDVHGSADCEQSLTCKAYVSGGSVSQFIGPASRTIPGSPPSVLVATSGRSLVCVPAGVGGETPRAAANGQVEVRDLRTGAVLASFVPRGRVTGLVFSGSTVAVLVVAGGAKRIVRYRSTDGALLGATPVPAATADSLSMDGTRVVFHVARAIRSVDVRTGAETTLLTAQATPIGLSLSGGRLAWGESYKSRGRWVGRIEAVSLG